MQIQVKNIELYGKLFDVTGYERCGVVLGKHLTNDTIMVCRFAELTNVHHEPEEHFRIRRSHVTAMLRRSMYAPLGYWHTHSDHHPPEPSANDHKQMEKYPQHIAMVFHQSTGTVTWFNHKIIIKMEVLEHAR